jgi:hypothetical protein
MVLLRHHHPELIINLAKKEEGKGVAMATSPVVYKEEELKTNIQEIISKIFHQITLQAIGSYNIH